MPSRQSIHNLSPMRTGLAWLLTAIWCLALAWAMVESGHHQHLASRGKSRPADRAHPPHAAAGVGARADSANLHGARPQPHHTPRPARNRPSGSEAPCGGASCFLCHLANGSLDAAASGLALATRPQWCAPPPADLGSPFVPSVTLNAHRGRGPPLRNA